MARLYRPYFDPKLNWFVHYGHQVDLKLNVVKAMLMTGSNNSTIILEVESINDVESFCYLGSMIAKQGAHQNVFGGIWRPEQQILHNLFA